MQDKGPYQEIEITQDDFKDHFDKIDQKFRKQRLIDLKDRKLNLEKKLVMRKSGIRKLKMIARLKNLNRLIKQLEAS